MAAGNVMSFAYPDAGLAFQNDGNLAVVGLAYRDVVRNGVALRSMPRSMRLLLIDPKGKEAGLKSFATQTLFMSPVSCHFFCTFDLARDLVTTASGEGDWTLRLTGDFRAQNGSMSESTIERKIRIVPKGTLTAQSVYPSWEPTPPNDGNFGLTWTQPQPGDVFPGLQMPVTFGGRRTLTGHYPVLELLDNAHKVVVTSQWFKSWSRSVPQLRTTVKAPAELNTARNTHQLRLSMIVPDSAGRSATAYHSFQTGAAAQPSVLAAGAGGRGATPKEFSPRSAAKPARARASEAHRLDLNKASAAEIAKNLPGVGPSLAKKIVAARPVKSVDQLVAIQGLSPLMVESLRGLVEW